MSGPGIQYGSGQYYQDTINGNVFIGSTAAAGVALAAYNATAVTFALWNPAGNSRNAVLISCDIGYISGTVASSTYTYSYQTGVGAQAATGSPITAATLGTPVNGYIGLGQSSTMKFIPATLTLAAGATLLKTIGAANIGIAATTTNIVKDNINGSIIVPPGTIFCVGTIGNSGITAAVSLVWEEI